MAEPQVTDPETTPTEVAAGAVATTSPPPAPASRARRADWLVLAAGIAVIGVALYGVRQASWQVRTGIGAVGVVAAWRSGQRLGAAHFGRRFHLGYLVSGVWVSLVVLAAIFADVLPIAPYAKPVFRQKLLRPGLRLHEPLGRDQLGRSLLSRCIYGGRVSLTVSIVAVVVGLAIGGILGLTGGFYGKKLDAGIGILTNSMLAFPPLVLLLAIIAVFQKKVMTLALALAVLTIPTFTRLVRAQTLTLRTREFVTAARAMGATSRRVMFRHILPNGLLPVLSYCFTLAALLIVAEGSLSFLGQGVPPPRPAWGTMIFDGNSKLQTDPHVVFVPAAVMFLTVLAFNRLGEWSRTAVFGERDTES
jgi:peptide/nickel transport system permease protein